MKISRSGSRSGWLSNQAWRRRATSGRSCSLACAVFFKRDPTPGKEAMHRAAGEALRMIAFQHGDQLVQRDVPASLYGGQSHLAERLDPVRPLIAAPWLGTASPVVAPGPQPRDRCRLANFEPATAALRDMPPSTAAITLLRRSPPYPLAIAAGLQPSQHGESNHHRVAQALQLRSVENLLKLFFPLRFQ